MLARLRNIKAQRIADRLADIQAFEQRELLAVRFDQRSQLIEHLFTPLRRQPGPSSILECAPCSHDCFIRVPRLPFIETGTTVVRREG